MIFCVNLAFWHKDGAKVTELERIHPSGSIDLLTKYHVVTSLKLTGLNLWEAWICPFNFYAIRLNRDMSPWKGQIVMDKLTRPSAASTAKIYSMSVTNELTKIIISDQGINQNEWNILINFRLSESEIFYWSRGEIGSVGGAQFSREKWNTEKFKNMFLTNLSPLN